MGWAALSELVPLYPLYALLFTDHGLSEAQISGLFALWSITSVLTEVPAGVLADRWSRRGAVVLAGVLQAVAFAVWTAAPGYAAFAAGFVIWGLGGALVSGASEALVFDGLAAAGASGSYARVNGWMTSAELLVQVPTALAASALFAVGGYALVGWASVGVCLAAAAVALRFPEAPRTTDDEDEVPLRQGVREALRSPALRWAVVAVALVGGLDAVEEYFPVMASDWGLPTSAVPVAVLSIALAGALGAALGGRADRLPLRWLPALLVLAAVCLAGSALWARPPALVLTAVFYGLYLAVLVVAEARLQDRITGPHRATITSVAGVGIEVSSLLVFAAWALGGALAVALLAVAVVPVVAAGLRVRAPVPMPRGRAAGTPSEERPQRRGSRG